MPKHRFRLATLLKLREAERDQRRTQLAEALLAAEKLRASADELTERLEQLRADSRRCSAPGPVAVDALVDMQRFELNLRAEQKLLAGQQETLEREIGRRRGALLEAERQVRLLEALRDKQKRRYEADARRRETARLDEIALQRYSRERR